MWCSTCQHDVSLPEDSGADFVRCGQCGTTLGYGDGIASVAAIAPPLAAPAIPDDDWQVEADIRSVHRLLESLQPARFDSPAALAAPHVSLVEVASEQPRPAAQAASPKGLTAWAIVSLSAAALACGSVLVGWSLATDRSDLWQIGLPVAIFGQAGMLVGLALYLEGRWHARPIAEAQPAAAHPQPTYQVHPPSAAPGPLGPAPESLAQLSGRLDLLNRHLSQARY
jgi:hypothetical protein